MHHILEHARMPECLDATMVSAFTRCPSYFYLRYVLGLEKKGIEGPDTSGRDWGSKWHVLSDTLVKTGDPGTALATLDPWPEHLNPDVDRHNRSKNRMLRIFLDYHDTYKDDHLKFEILRSEQYFRVTIPEWDRDWCGIMDLVVRDRETGEVKVMDRKTTSYLYGTYFDEKEYSVQFPGYVRAAGLLTTEPVDKLILDVLHTLKSDHHHYRKTFRYSPAQIREWTSNTGRIVERIYELGECHLYEPEAWTKSWDNCTRYYKPCQFTDIHWLTAESDTRLRILENDYRERRWDPETAREEAEI